MNPTEKNHSSAENDRFDRLVDGELSESERKSLLESLEARPDGWRRCALAFLEAQTWRESLGELMPPVRKTPPVPLSTLPPSPKRRKSLGAMGNALAMAACFLVALSLGSLAYRGVPWGKSAAGPMNNSLAESKPATPTPITQSPAIAVQTEPSNPSTANTWQLVNVKAPALTGNDEPLQIPAVERDRLDDDFYRSIPNPLPGDLLQALKRTGNDVRLHRELVPMQLPDGRRLIVPVDRVEVQYDGNRAY
jgi:hypothetical protein